MKSMPFIHRFVLALSLILPATAGVLIPHGALAEGKMVSHGGDVYVSHSTSTLNMDTPRDAFLTGFAVEVDGAIDRDAHAAGFDVDIDGSIGADLYAVGANVSVQAPVREDLTVSGFTVEIDKGASVGGNARIAGGTVRMAAPVSGSLMVTGGVITLDSVVTGDVRLSGAEITLGPDAGIGGLLTYSAPEEITIPESVIPESRVRYIPYSHAGKYGDIGKTIEDSIPAFWPSVLGTISTFIVILAFLLLVAALFLAFQPRRVQSLRERAVAHTGLSVLTGFLGLATLFGLIPVSAMTLVGIPLIPVAVLFILAMWTLGYLLGTYVVAMRLTGSFRDIPVSTGGRLLVLAAALVGLALINYIPFIGWIFNLSVMFLGLGSITLSAVNTLSRRDATDILAGGESAE